MSATTSDPAGAGPTAGRLTAEERRLLLKHALELMATNNEGGWAAVEKGRVARLLRRLAGDGGVGKR